MNTDRRRSNRVLFPRGTMRHLQLQRTPMQRMGMQGGVRSALGMGPGYVGSGAGMGGRRGGGGGGFGGGGQVNAALAQAGIAPPVEPPGAFTPPPPAGMGPGDYLPGGASNPPGYTPPPGPGAYLPGGVSSIPSSAGPNPGDFPANPYDLAPYSSVPLSPLALALWQGRYLGR